MTNPAFVFLRSRTAGRGHISMHVSGAVQQVRTLASAAGLTLIATLGGIDPALAQTTVLNVSYDPTRELYRDVNEAFLREWVAKPPAAGVGN